MSDLIHNPEHYCHGGIDTIDFVKAKLTKEEMRGAMLFNVYKYLSRYSKKDGVKDLEKASVYLKWLINVEKDEPLEK